MHKSLRHSEWINLFNNAIPSIWLVVNCQSFECHFLPIASEISQKRVKENKNIFVELHSKIIAVFQSHRHIPKLFIVARFYFRWAIISNSLDEFGPGVFCRIGSRRCANEKALLWRIWRARETARLICKLLWSLVVTVWREKGEGSRKDLLLSCRVWEEVWPLPESRGLKGCSPIYSLTDGRREKSALNISEWKKKESRKRRWRHKDGHRSLKWKITLSSFWCWPVSRRVGCIGTSFMFQIEIRRSICVYVLSGLSRTQCFVASRAGAISCASWIGAPVVLTTASGSGPIRLGTRKWYVICNCGDGEYIKCNGYDDALGRPAFSMNKNAYTCVCVKIWTMIIIMLMIPRSMCPAGTQKPRSSRATY